MEWWPLAAFAVVWATVLIPRRWGRRSPRASVQDFERKMELLAQTERTQRGRWIVTPRKGVRFLGRHERAKARARERRRRVFVFLLESIALTFLMGLVPPLRVVWYGAAGLVGLLVLYVWLLLTIKHRGEPLVTARGAAAAVPRTPARPLSERHVAEGKSRLPRPAFNGLGSLGEGDLVHVVVRPSRRVGVAGA